jgi:hypothetical protein
MPSFVLCGLIERRKLLTVEVRRTESALHHLLLDIDHLDATIRQFDPDYRVPSLTMASLGTGAQVTRTILTIMRKTPEPMSLTAITISFMTTVGLDHRNMKRFRQVKEQIRTAMTRQRKNGTVEAAEGPGHSLIWRIAG